MSAARPVGLLIAGVLAYACARTVSSDRSFALALRPFNAEALAGRELKLRSSALRRHLAEYPGDVLAADLLNSVDTELIRRIG